MDPDDFPVIGEPVSVELANSLYVEDDGATDFVATPELARMWFALSPTGSRLPATALRSQADVDRLRALRDATRAILTAVVDEDPIPASAVELVNRACAEAPIHRILAVEGRAVTVTNRMPPVSETAALIGLIAADVIDVVGGRSIGLLRRCETPGCGLFFVKNHARRKFCHVSCEHRTRQARYQRRRLLSSTTGTPRTRENGFDHPPAER